MKDFKRAFGSPDPEFTDRVRQTLFRIEEKEETVVKKKLTFSMALALILCVCIVTMSALAGTELIKSKPDITQPPLSQSENQNPNGEQAGPQTTRLPNGILGVDTEIYWPSEAGNIFHLDEKCKDMSYPCTVITLSSALKAGGEACPLCFKEVPSFSTFPDPSPALTPMPTEAAAPAYVWSAYGDICYHADHNCAQSEDGVVRTTLLVALNRGQSACPVCFGIENAFSTSTPMPAVQSPDPTPVPDIITPDMLSGHVFWPVNRGAVFHCSLSCEDMSFPYSILLPEDALNAGGVPCGLCHSQPAYDPYSTPTPMPTILPEPTQTPPPLDAMRLNAEAAVRAVYLSEADKTRFHSIPVCGAIISGETVSLPLTAALNQGARPCLECLACWIEDGSELCHMSETCSRLSGAQIQTVIAAILDEYDYCALCVRFFDLNNGRHHRFARCSAFGGADVENAYIPCSLNFTRLLGSTPCELCAAGDIDPLAAPTPMPTGEPGRTAAETNEPISDMTVFLWDANAPVYHALYNCSGYEYPYQMQLSEAIAENLAPCPGCVLSETSVTGAAIGSVPPLWSTGSSEIYFYDYTGGYSDYFHTGAACDAHPMTEPVAISLETAFRYELPPCPACSNLLNQVIITEPGSKFYHLSNECGLFASPEYVTLYEAKKLGLAPCPDCTDRESVNTPTVSPSMPAPTQAPIESSSSNAVYPSRGGDSLFHRTPLCGETVTAPSVSLIDALNTGLIPCPDCYGSEAVYTVNGGEAYHHSDKTCFLFLASSSLSMEVSLTEALLRGKVPCVECVPDNPDENDGGDSVLVSDYASYYHASGECSGLGALPYRISVTDALKKGLFPCPACSAGDDALCIISESSTFYHSCESVRNMGISRLVREITIGGAQRSGRRPCECMTPGAASESTAYECRADLIGETFYYSIHEDFYHLESVCGGIEYPETARGAQVHLLSLDACPVCLPGRTQETALDLHGLILSDEETLPLSD